MKKYSLFLALLLVMSNNAFAANKNNSTRKTTLEPKEIFGFISNESSYVNKFNELSKVRVGLNNQEIDDLKNPFTTTFIPGKEVALATESSYKLTAIIGRRAKINNKWYSIGDFVGTYKLIGIGSQSVEISNDTNTLKLKLDRGNKNVNITFN